MMEDAAKDYVEKAKEVVEEVKEQIVEPGAIAEVK